MKKRKNKEAHLDGASGKPCSTKHASMFLSRLWGVALFSLVIVLSLVTRLVYISLQAAGENNSFSGLNWKYIGRWRPQSSSEAVLAWDGAEFEAGKITWAFHSGDLHSNVFRLRAALTLEEVSALRSALPTNDEDWTLRPGDLEKSEIEWVMIEKSGVEMHSVLSALTRPLIFQRLLPFVREKYACPTCVVCNSMIRRYNGKDRHRDPPHFDVYGFVTVVLSLTGQEEYDGPGLYVQANDPKSEHGLEMNRGDLVMHQWDLRHGVRIAKGERLSWIMWIGDTADCRKNSARWYGPRWQDKRDPIAAFQLGLHHDGSKYGHELFKAAADDGMLYALYQEGVAYAGSLGGVDNNSTRAFLMLQKAASKGFVHAQAVLGSSFAAGKGCNKDVEAAEHWYREAASFPAEHAQAQLMLGELLLSKGRKAEGESWIRKAAEQGVPEARSEMLKWIAERGNPKGEDAPLFLWSAVRAGDSDAMLILALHFCKKGASAVHEKIHWYTKAAAAGNAAATQNLGSLYYYGEGDVAPDPSAALHWFEKAASAGLSEAAYEAGMLSLEFARTDSQEEHAAVEFGVRAKKHLEMAAEKGHLGGMGLLGLELCQGTPGFGGKQESLGAAWVRKAAEGGSSEAMWIWAQMAAAGGYGPGTPDLQQARMWMLEAANSGHESAIAALRDGGLPTSSAVAEL